jgi:hypothetical protein
MTSVIQGSSITLEAQFYEYAGGPPEDITSLTVKIVPVVDSVPILGPTGLNIAHPGTGLYAYTWAVSASQAPGDYTVIWDGFDASMATVQASEVVSVVSASSGTWASAADVLAITGKTVSDSVVTQAQNIIDMFTARPYTTSEYVGLRDRHYLKLALAYQAAWIPTQPDLFGRLNYSGLTQDGNTVNLNENALVLAPMARQALKKVSWLKSRSLHVQSAFIDGSTAISANPSSEANDAVENWVPMGRFGMGR